MRQDYPDAYRPLAERLALTRGLPWTPRWSAAPDFLELLLEAVRVRRPRCILECSTGLTTLVLARACQLVGRGRVWGLENGADHAEASRAALAAYGLQDRARVLHAPLVPTRLEEGEWQWYDLAALPPLQAELLVIDGPPGFLQPLSRYPALPRLAASLAPGALVLLDDAHRDDERRIVRRWRQRWPALEVAYLPTERGCVQLQWPEA